MTALQAALTVLRQAGEALRFDEITRRMLAAGLWATAGKTPEATVHARLAVDIQEQGAASAFQRTAKGTFALREWALPEYVPKHAAKESDPAGVEPSAPAPMPVPIVPPEPPKRQTLSFTDAAEQILETHGGRQPMHYRDLTVAALEAGLVSTAGKTPEATLYAQVLTETKRRTRRGEQARFVMHGKGYIGLARWMGQGLAFQIEQHNRTVGKRLHDRIRRMDPVGFEQLIAELLAALGFEEVTVTARSGDGGIDVRGTLVVGEVIRTRMAVQAKRWKQNIQAPIVQQVRGSLGTHEQGLIITVSDFSKGAREEAERPDAVPVGLMNGEQLVRLLIENDIGVSRLSHDILELGEE